VSSGGSRQVAVGRWRDRLYRRLPPAFCFLLTALAVLPLFSDPGFLLTRGIGDSPNLLFRVQQLLTALAAGEFPARWMPDAAYGYGMPYFTYYASASTHVAALLKLYGFSFVAALKLTQALALLAGAAGMFGWLRALGAPRAAAGLAAAAYTFTPFHLVNVYIRGDSLAELGAMGLFPLALWAAQRLAAQPGFGRALVLALAAAALVCTHNVSALIFLPFLGLQVIACSFQENARHRMIGVLALLWGLALAAFFWLPALAEGGAVQLGDLTQGYFFYGNHFRGADLLQAGMIFDYQSQPFSLGLIPTALAAAGALALAWRAGRERRWTWTHAFLFIGLAVSTLMVTPLSRPVWEALPLLRYTQFPWRFLGLQALFASALAAGLWRWEASDTPPSAVRRPRADFLAAGTGALLLAAAGLLGLRPEFIPLTDADVTAGRLNLYEYATTAIGNTVNSEYLPQAVRPRPFTSDVMLGRAPRLKTLSGAAEGERRWKRGAREQWRITVAGDAPATVAAPTYFWPGWRGEADGAPLAVRAADGLGWLAFDVPPGAHTVTLWLDRTPLRAAAEVFSLLALIVPSGVAAYRRAHTGELELKIRAFGYSLRSFVLRPLSFVLGLLVLGFGILRFLPDAPPSPLPLNIDFDTLAYPHHDRVRFEGGFALTRLAYSVETAARGEAVTVQTEWDLARSVSAHFRLRLPPPSSAQPPVAVTLPLAPDPDGKARAHFTATLPADLAPGLYFWSVELSDQGAVYPAVTATGRPRGLVYLAPLVVDDAGVSEASVEPPLADWGGLVRVVTAAAGLEAGDTLLARVEWQALADLPKNYQVALRLLDSAGEEWARGGDVQTVAGYYPTALWRPGEVVVDAYRFALAGPGEPPGAYTLALSLYDVETLQPLGEARVPVALNRRHPRDGRAAQFTLNDQIGIEAVDIPAEAAQGETLTVVVRWLTEAAPAQNYRARWTLSPGDAPPGDAPPGDAPAGRLYEIIADLAPGSPPRTWFADAWLIGRARLPLPDDLPPGRYALGLQLEDETGQAVGPEVEVGATRVTGRERAFAAPPLQTRVGAIFDDQLTLWGYDVERVGSELRLTLAWGALAKPRGDYKYFVHVFNPADEVIVAQADAAPRAFTYPTTLWVAGEVVTDTVMLDLSAAPPGDYRVAVGWYDPAAPDLARLPAFDAQGRRLGGDRVILPLELRPGE